MYIDLIKMNDTVQYIQMITEFYDGVYRDRFIRVLSNISPDSEQFVHEDNTNEYMGK